MTENIHDAEPNDADAEKRGTSKKKISKKLLIVIAIVLLTAIGGFVGYTKFFGGKSDAQEKGHTDAKSGQKSALVPLDPFVVNLSEPGRYLKLTMQLEVESSSNQSMVTEKMPNLRDAVITLLSSKSAESVASPEGKFQLKDELILRVNQAVGKEIFKNLYFTEFVMQ